MSMYGVLGEERRRGMFELVWVVKRKKAERKKAESPAWTKAWGPM